MSEAALTAIVVTEYFLIAYFLGSIPFGLLFAKLFGVKDVRQAGSGNIGATNVTRVVGVVPGVLTLLFDAAKGVFAVVMAARGSDQGTSWIMLAAIGALVGHCFPIWLKFKGGKGVATAVGVFLMLCPVALGIGVLLFVFVVAVWRYVSLGSIAAAAAMPLLVYFFWAPHHAPPHTVSAGTLLAAILIVGKHRGNIRRMWTGEEPRFTLRPKKENE